MSATTLTPCPICADNDWQEQEWSWDRWLCATCGIRCAIESGVMMQVPQEGVLIGEADAAAREALGAQVRDEETWAEDNRRMCDLLHRGRAA